MHEHTDILTRQTERHTDRHKVSFYDNKDLEATTYLEVEITQAPKWRSSVGKHPC